MAKSIFGISVSSDTLPRETILQVSKRVVQLFIDLSQVDKIFANPFFLGKDDNGVYPLNLHSPTTEKELAELILRFEHGNISKYGNERNPTIDFSHDFGFSHLFQIREGQDKLFNISMTFGRTLGGGIAIRNFNNKRQFDFEWYHLILKCLVSGIDAEIGSVSISNKAFIDLSSPLRIKYPLGWITYFSNRFGINIPNDLNDIEYEYADNGKYLILTRNDFTSDKEIYFAHREKLLNLMEEIKRRVPEYSK